MVPHQAPDDHASAAALAVDGLLRTLCVVLDGPLPRVHNATVRVWTEFVGERAALAAVLQVAVEGKGGVCALEESFAQLRTLFVGEEGRGELRDPSQMDEVAALDGDKSSTYL